MRKYLPFFLLVLLFAASPAEKIQGAGWSPADMVPAFKNLKRDVVGQLNDLFGREVSVESVSGILVNQIELNNVSIAKGRTLRDGAMIKAKQVIINYNPLKLAASRGDITAAISKITVIEPEIFVERSPKDTWNMAELIPKGKPIEGEKEPSPIPINATVSIKGGYGIYMDHIGWGEDLRGKPFVSKIRDFNGEVKLSGSRVNLTANATSVIDRAVAYTRVIGNLNVRTGKYKFIVYANNVDIEKWGYYTMNIPHFKALTGRSDMTLTMTNPPPRKKGQPILFDGKFNIKNGRARIFGEELEDIRGFVRVFDEEVTLKDVTGSKGGVAVTGNGTIKDFMIAYYDIKLDIPSTLYDRIAAAYPQLGELAFKGNISASVHIGGNYGKPEFSGIVPADGLLFGQKIKGDFVFSNDGTVLNVSGGPIRAYGGALVAKGAFDFIQSPPSITIAVSGEGLNGGSIVPSLPLRDKVSVQASIKGTTDMFNISGFASPNHGVGASSVKNAQLSVSGTCEKGVIVLSMKGSGFSLSNNVLQGEVTDFAAEMNGRAGPGGLEDLAVKGDLSLIKGMFLEQPVNEANAAFIYKDAMFSIDPLTINAGASTTVRASVRSMKDGSIAALISAASAEAEELKILNRFFPKEFTPVAGAMDVSLEAGLGRDLAPSSLTLKGRVSLKNGSIANEKVDSAYMEIEKTKDAFDLRDSHIKGKFTDLRTTGSFKADGSVELAISGRIDLSNLKPLTLKFGRLFGYVTVECRAKGKAPDLYVDAGFSASQLRYNEVIVDRAEGHILYEKEIVSLSEPIRMFIDDDAYTLSGGYDLRKKEISSFIRLDIEKGSFSTITTLFDEVNAEISSRQLFRGFTGQSSILLSPSKFRFPEKQTSLLYMSKGNSSRLEEMNSAFTDSAAYGLALKEKVERKAAGSVTGYVDISGSAADLSGEMDINIRNGSWESYSFDEARIKGTLRKGTFEAESVYIREKDGMLTVKGTIDPRSHLMLDISANEMPIDFLKLVMGKGKTFEGRFNMSASLAGKISSLSGEAELTASNINMGGVGLDSLDGRLRLANNTLYFRKLDMVSGDRKSSLTGTFPLTSEGISMNITLEGSAVGLLTLMSQDILWLSGNEDGKASLRVTGSIRHPCINGNISLEGADIGIVPMNSSLRAIRSWINIRDNRVSTESFSAKWAGSWTANQVNKVKISGYVDWDGIYGSGKRLDMDLALADGSFYVDIPNLYKGDMDVRNFSLKGGYSSTEGKEAAPVLSGIFTVQNGVITLPDMSKKSSLPPAGLDLQLNILKNTYVSAGDVKNLISTDFSNLLMNLEVQGENIMISGTLDEPGITGKTLFKHGTVNILNREFSLMTEDRQKELFGSSLEKVKENSAVFSGGSLPYLNLSSEIKIKDTEKVGDAKAGETVQYQTVNVLVVSRITGIPFSKDKETGINLTFDSFIEDTSKQPPELVPGKYDQEEIKVLLLPDFIKGPLGITEKGVEGVDANSVLVDYLNSRLNSYILRDVERNLARSLELESLTLEYNFGKDLRNMLPEKTETPLSPQTAAPETMYGIGAVKNFFDRFYLDVKYSQAVQEQPVINKAFLNYQLTYKLSPIVSVVYYREPFSFLEEESDYYKVTLKAGYQL